jgi:hypothetical protein
VRADALAHTQLMMAQSIELLANHIEQSTGYQLTPVTYAELPMAAQAGMIACVTDSTARVIGNVVGGGGTNTVLAWCNGAQWLVLGGAAPFVAAGQVVVANPASTTSTTYIMMGLGLSFTSALGRAFVTIDGQIMNSNNNGETYAQLMWGVGAAPVYGVPPPAGAAVIGTQIRYKSTSSAGGGAFVPFSQSGMITGLPPGQQIWIGLALRVISGTGSVQDIALSAHELL